MISSRDKIMISLWVPLAWVSLLTADIIIFSEGRAKGLLGRLFEDLVFVMSFFFYGTGPGIRGSPMTLILPFFIQFFFWWLLSYAVIWTVTRKR